MQHLTLRRTKAAQAPAHASASTLTLALALAAAMLLGSLPAFAMPLLGPDLASFAVLGGSTVTNVPISAVGGNVGVWSSGDANAIAGFLSAPGVAEPDPQVSGGLVVTTPGGGLEVAFLPFAPVDGGLQVPEPGTLLLVAIGLLGAVGVSRRRWLIEKFSARVPEPLSEGLVLNPVSPAIHPGDDVAVGHPAQRVLQGS